MKEAPMTPPKKNAPVPAATGNEGENPYERNPLMNTVPLTFPERVYRHTGDEPPFTRQMAENIAVSKPAWAEFDSTDITGDPENDETLTKVGWCLNIGDVTLIQDVTYVRATGEKISEEKPYIRSWTEKFTDPIEACMHAANLEDAGRKLDEILEADDASVEDARG